MLALTGVTNTAIRRNKMICRNLIIFIAYFCSFNQLPVPVIDQMHNQNKLFPNILPEE